MRFHGHVLIGQPPGSEFDFAADERTTPPSTPPSC